MTNPSVARRILQVFESDWGECDKRSDKLDKASDKKVGKGSDKKDAA